MTQVNELTAAGASSWLARISAWLSRVMQRRLSDALTFLVVSAAVLASRVPFLGADYGTMWDAYRVAAAARYIATNGYYVASRDPGHPVQEFVYAVVSWLGPLGLNGLTAALSAVAAGAVAILFRRLGSREYAWAALALAFTPVVFVHSTDTLDYVWALALTLLAQYLALRGWPIASGASLGLAVGCRITAGVMLLPTLVILCSGQRPREASKRLGMLMVSSLTPAVLAYLPVVADYGPKYFLIDSSIDAMNRFDAALVGSAETWGVVGSLALGVAGCLAAADFIRRRIQSVDGGSIPGGAPGAYFVAWFVAGLIYVAGFMLHPTQPGYLVPVVPLVLLVSARYLARAPFAALCACLCISSFVLGLNRDTLDRALSPRLSGPSLGFSAAGERMSLDLLCGPICIYQSSRVQTESLLARALAVSNTSNEPNVVLAGQWLLMLQMLVPPDEFRGVYGVQTQVAHPGMRAEDSTLLSRLSFTRGATTYVVLLDSTQVADAVSRGDRFYVMPGVADMEKHNFGVDLLPYGAQILE